MSSKQGFHCKMKQPSHFGKQQIRRESRGPPRPPMGSGQNCNMGSRGAKPPTENKFVCFHMPQNSSLWLKIVHFYHSKKLSNQILKIINFNKKKIKKTPTSIEMLTFRGQLLSHFQLYVLTFISVCWRMTWRSVHTATYFNFDFDCEYVIWNWLIKYLHWQKVTFAYAMNSHASAELDTSELLSCFRVLPRSWIPRVIDSWAQIFKNQN